MSLRKFLFESRPVPDRSGSNGVLTSPEQYEIPASGAPTHGAAGAPSADTASTELGLVLDALSGVLGAIARYPIDLPDRAGSDRAEEIAKWSRHVTYGYAVDDVSESVSLSVMERDWDGVVRVVAEQRRAEHQYTESAIAELRDALWSCVETVHNAVRIDRTADASTNEQMDRAKHALKRMQPGTIKQEVLDAMAAIDVALKARRTQQHEQFVSLATKLDKMGKQLEEARQEITTDQLTGIGNRKLFETMGPRAVHLYALSGQPVVLLLIDLDNLKLVNDMYGRRAGDQAIINIANALSKVFLRQSDVLCRYVGDEFAVILHNTDAKMAQTLARRLQEQMVGLPTPHPAMEFAVSASVGIAQLEAHEELDEWIARADNALETAKKNGLYRVCVSEGLLLRTA